MPSQRVYPPAERPDVEVLVDGAWYAGELRAWTPGPDGWVAQVQWRRVAGETRLANFPAAEVRLAVSQTPDEVRSLRPV